PVSTVEYQLFLIEYNPLEIDVSPRNRPLFAFSSHNSISLSDISFFWASVKGLKSRYFSSRCELFIASTTSLYLSTKAMILSNDASVSLTTFNVADSPFVVPWKLNVMLFNV